MQIHYESGSNTVTLRKKVKYRGVDDIVDQHFWEGIYTLGDLLLDYIEIDFEQITKKYNKIFDSLLLDEVDDIDNFIKNIRAFSKELIGLHPFFWDFYYQITNLSEDFFSDFKQLVDRFYIYILEDDESHKLVVELSNDDTELVTSGFEEYVGKIKSCLNTFSEAASRYKKAVDFCLNIDAKIEIKEIPPLERYILYKSFADKGLEDIHIDLIYESSSFINSEKTNNLKELTLNEIAELLPDAPYSIHEVYDVDVEVACHLEFMKLIMRNTPIGKCKNCNKYFISSGRTDTLYCDRYVDKDGKTCKDVGAMNVYRDKIKEDPIMELYNKVYKRYNARVRYKKISQEDFYNWSELARDMRDKAREGKITLEEFKEWLNSN